MKNEKINTTLQNENAEKNTENEKWETPEMLVISIDNTLADNNKSFFDGAGFGS